MDANGQRFWLALGGTPWSPRSGSTLDRESNRLQLASESNAASYPENPTLAEAALQQVPGSADTFGTWAFYDDATKTVRGTGALSDSVPILSVASGATDVALGFEGYLYVATNGAVLIHDLSGRWADSMVAQTGFNAFRIAPDPQRGAWVLDRAGKKLSRLIGRLWPAPLPITIPPDAFQPVVAADDPFHFEAVTTPWLAPDEDPVGLACSLGGRVAFLVWTPTGARIRLFDTLGRLGPALELQGITRPFSIAWISEERIALLAPAVPEALVFSFPASGNPPSLTTPPVGDIYPLRNHNGTPLLHGVSWPVEYIAKQPTADNPGNLILRPLVAASLPAFASSAMGVMTAPFDSGTGGTSWHRLYVEAEIPKDTSFTLSLAASDTEEDPANITSDDDWHPHHFGSGPLTRTAEPRAAWVSERSELPGQEGFCEEPPEKDSNGLFTVLIQRSNRPVRTLRGRFLHLRIEMRGTLRSTPCIFAIRAYGPRFSYQDKYLPALYRETLFGADADEVAPNSPSTRPDFLGRFLANFESVLTPLEDQIASSWLLTDPRKTPDSALDWLGSWIGVAYEPWYPVSQRRAYLQNAPELFRARGTLRGLQLALDIATGGGVTQGRIVVVEDFWFRRTLQTILGLDLDELNDPLFGGPVVSGNSKVGRTLILSEYGLEQEFLALFNASIQLKGGDQKTVDDFFASMAFRATIVVHDAASPDELKLISRIAAMDTPAHLTVRVQPASQQFLVGLAALIGLDTYLGAPPPTVPVQIDKSQLGDGSLLLRPPSLDPRLEGAPS